MSSEFKRDLFDNNLLRYHTFIVQPINVTVRPTEFPLHHFLTVTEKQRIMNKLIYNLTKSPWHEIKDAFYDELNDIRSIKPSKRLEGVFIRTDYLLDKDDTMKQVEINTISCAFVFWGPTLNRVHRKYDGRTVVSDSDVKFMQFLKKINKHSSGEICIMIDNDTSMNTSNYYEKVQIMNMCREQGILMKHHTFKDIRNLGEFTYKGNVVTDDEIKVRLKTRKAFSEPLEMTFQKKKVFALYYRWFYNQSHYTDEDFILRAKLECCNAFSLPTVELQIAGLKIFQMKFTDTAYLEEFLSVDEIKEIYEHFGEFKPIKDLAPGDEEDFILKNIKEGGGNNVYGEDIRHYEGNTESVFLMKKIEAPTCENAFIDGVQRRTIPEIGIMGWLLAVDGEIVSNENAGYICRSKDENSKECGVSCGYGALDSIINIP